MGEGAGGLLNATFGNAAELIIAVVALSKGLSSVVKASITGSIIGNILLVLGLSILCGGTKYNEQRFNRTGARTSAISLSLAAIALIIPTVFHVAADAQPKWLESDDGAAAFAGDRRGAFYHLLLRAQFFAQDAPAFLSRH